MIILLDRDGVINKNVKGQYVSSWEGFEFLPRSLEAIRRLSESGLEINIVSNQAGVAKGIYTKAELDRITRNMLTKIEEAGGQIKAVYYCLHRDEDNCNCRKPKTGLYEQAIAGRKIDKEKVIVIGDSERDIVAGKKLGYRTILVLSGNTKNREAVDNFEVKPDSIALDLLDAVETVLVKEE
ncbi:MAG: HAD family hydrolase [PVC group bacterium]|nr:HAD family hydrolase [PVC group bacterium]